MIDRRFEYSMLNITLSGISMSRDYEGRLADVISQKLQEAELQGWEPDEPTSLEALFRAGRITYHREQSLLGHRVKFDEASIRMRRRLRG